MYININEFSWQETLSEILITVTFPNNFNKLCDCVVGPRYIKLLKSPYVFECVLYDKTDYLKSKVKILNGKVYIYLTKFSSSIWNQLEYSRNDLDNWKDLRLKSIEECRELDVQNSNKNSELKRASDKFTLNEQLNFDSKDRTRIAVVKDTIAKDALNDMVKFKNKFPMQKEKKSIKCQVENSTQNKFTNETLGKEEVKKMDELESELLEKIKNEKKLHKHGDIPVRDSTSIKFNFTPRVFPTPERESYKQMEEDWLTKQNMLKKEHYDKLKSSEDFTIKENDPLWLKSKGDSLFNNKDFEGAVAAYTRALELNPKLFTLYSNRAACYIGLRLFFKALDDASKALELLTPPVPANAKSRKMAHTRRGCAFFNLKMYKESLIEYEMAKKLDPNDESLDVDIKKINVLLNGDDSE